MLMNVKAQTSDNPTAIFHRSSWKKKNERDGAIWRHLVVHLMTITLDN